YYYKQYQARRVLFGALFDFFKGSNLQMSALEGLRKQFGINKKMASFLMAGSMIFNLGLSAAPLAMAVSQPTAKLSFTFDDSLDSADTYVAPILKAAGYTA